MCFHKLTFARRKNSFNARSIPCPLVSKIKNPNVLPKLRTISKNFNDVFIPENEVNYPKEELGDNNVGFQSKIFDNEPVVDSEIPNVIYLSQNRHVVRDEINIKPLPKLCSPNKSGFDQIFKDKISLCNIIFDFTQSRGQISGKREKYVALIEINTLLSQKEEASLLSSYHQDLILEMIKKNIFEQDAFTTNEKITLMHFKLNFVERSWEQLSIVYKILHQFVLLFPQKVDISLCKKAINLMNIPDLNERESLITFLKNYSKTHPNHFDDIFHFLKSALTNARYDIYTPYCLDPIISYMMILYFESVSSYRQNYFSSILHTHLLPLFDHEYLSVYYNKLSNLVIQIIDNDYDEQINVILFLIKHFPYQCGSKQPLFVSTINSIIDSISWKPMNPIAEKLFSIIANGVKSPNSKLAESDLLLLMKQNMKPIILSNYEMAMDILYEPLKWSSAFYWNKFVKDQSSNALSTLISANLEFQRNKSMSDFLLGSELPTASSNPVLNSKSSLKKDISELASTWASIFRVAARNDRSIDLTKSLLKINVEFKSQEKNNQATPTTNDKIVCNSLPKVNNSPIKYNPKIRNFKSNFV